MLIKCSLVGLITMGVLEDASDIVRNFGKQFELITAFTSVTRSDITILVDYEGANLTVHLPPSPRTAEVGFMYFV